MGTLKEIHARGRRRGVEEDPPVNPEDIQPTTTIIDYRQSKIPRHVVELIETSLAIEAEAAKKADALGFMARALTQATMPHRDPKTLSFQRVNGNFALTMLAGYALPFGSVPRLLVSWVTSEAKRTKERHLVLGDSLSDFMRELGLHITGGSRGDITRLKEQATRLFSTSVSCIVREPGRSIEITNLQIADTAKIWWDPKNPEQLGLWPSTVTLSENFYKEVTERPVPVDLRAIAALKQSPLALDIYCWLTYRMSYLEGKSRPIPWPSLQVQFGSGYATDAQGTRDFKKAFLRELKSVLMVYPRARVELDRRGLVLKESPTHVAIAVPAAWEQGSLL